MASRILHLATTELLLRELSLADPQRLKLGAILPDAPNHPRGSYNSHFKVRRPDGRKHYDLAAFCTIFGETLQSDALCLGYYLHLIQDTVFRRFVYDMHHWDPYPAGNPQRLHGDYARLNPLVIAQYGLQYDLCAPQNFDATPLQMQFQFDLTALLADAQADFLAKPTATEAFFFTEEMADAYVTEATVICRSALTALYEGQTTTEIAQYAWQ